MAQHSQLAVSSVCGRCAFDYRAIESKARQEEASLTASRPQTRAAVSAHCPAPRPYLATAHPQTGQRSSSASQTRIARRPWAPQRERHGWAGRAALQSAVSFLLPISRHPPPNIWVQGRESGRGRTYARAQLEPREFARRVGVSNLVLHRILPLVAPDGNQLSKVSGGDDEAA